MYVYLNGIYLNYFLSIVHNNLHHYTRHYFSIITKITILTHLRIEKTEHCKNGVWKNWNKNSQNLQHFLGLLYNLKKEDWFGKSEEEINKTAYYII